MTCAETTPTITQIKTITDSDYTVSINGDQPYIEINNAFTSTLCTCNAGMEVAIFDTSGAVHTDLEVIWNGDDFSSIKVKVLDA